MKKISIKQKTIIIIALILIVVILSTIFTVNIMKNKNLSKEGYMGATANASSTLVASYIKKGITIGGITGTLEVLDTSDATAKEEDIAWGKTGYVNGIKITGTRIDTVAQGKECGGFVDKNTVVLDDLNNEVVIPEGFKVASDSGTKVEEGVVIEDKSGNQFVWIPAKTGAGATIHTSKGNKTIVYKRTAYSINTSTGQIDSETNSEIISYDDYSYYFTEALDSDEESSINKNGGYYIGRYESGDKEATEAKTMRTGATEKKTITIKKGQVPYNYITQVDAKKISEEMSIAEGYKAKTKLISGYAWDTAISFMQLTNEDYGNSSIEGNYSNVAFTYTDIKGNSQTKSNGSKTLVPTGQTTAVCNIYDMGGNVFELTTEKTSSNEAPFVNRGGDYRYDYDNIPAGRRDGAYDNAYDVLGFRVALYVQ